MINIVLIGYRCTGKTEVGKIVARDLGYNFIDTDVLVEKEAGATISQIVARHGWPKFRVFEKKAIARVSKLSDAVIATGGGAVLDGENVANLRRNGVVFFLDAAPEVIFARMKNDAKTDTQRPKLTDKDALSEIKVLVDERAEKYLAASDYRIDTSDIAADAVARSVLVMYKRRRAR